MAAVTAAPLDLAVAAHGLAARLPALLVEAKRVAATVAFGTHGRRRVGPGETFWQFRPYSASDAASAIDWRRSAASDTLFVREREWEAAHTVWLWADLSPSMGFQSHLAPTPKRDRALLLAMALAELLAAGGERVGAVGLMPPQPGRRGAERLALHIAQHEATQADNLSLPPAAKYSRFAECVLIGDFLDPAEEVAAAVEAIAAQGVEGHLIQVLDPAEETLPYRGRVEFTDMEATGRHLAERAEAIRTAYGERLTAHRAALTTLARRLGWTFRTHHTDRPATEALIACHAALSGQAAYRTGAGAAEKIG